MPNRKDKPSKRRSSFRTFGAFLTSHMMKKFNRKTKSKRNAVDNAALEAGFIDDDSRKGMGNGAPPNGQSKSGMSSETTSLSGKGAYSTNLNGSFTPPGVCGLANHGATCYINAVLQCLSNTDLLAEYFVMGQYRSDLKNAKKERSKKYGTSGELAEQVAVIIKSLWMNQYDVSMTKGLKEIMCKYSTQYKGNGQHDCQEFLLWLFDKVHEDLNIQPLPKRSLLSKASFRRKKKNNVANGWKPNLESREIQAQLDLVPTSFIEKVFQAHFRSSLTCPNCKRQSHTMDPSLCVSLPIRQRTTRPIYVNVAYLSSKRRRESRKKSSPKLVQIAVAVPLDGKVSKLRQLVSADCGIHSRLLSFVEYDDKGFGNSYGDDYLIDDLPQVTPSASKLYAFEMPAPMSMTAGTLPRNFASRHKKRPSFGDGTSIRNDVLGSPDGTSSSVPKNIVVILANRKSDGKIKKVFGRPIIFHVSKDILSNDLRSLIVTKMTDQIKKGVDVEKLVSSMKLEVVDGIPNKSVIPEKATQPLMTPNVETALEKCVAGGPLHVKLIAEWTSDDVEALFEESKVEPPEELESVRLQRLLHQQPVTCTLQECFDLLTKPEELGLEDSWMCPHCHKQRHGTVKKLSLYTLPDVLVVHLKRFQVVNDKRTKLNTRVDFPIMGLDMTPYLLESSKPTQNGALNGLRNHVKPQNSDCLYDLYAVCNHFGNLNSGHYTASCLNPLDGQWYLFDDRKTELISDEHLSQQSVYILFYQRRSINPSAPCAGGSVSSLAMSDHWAISLQQQQSRQKASSQSRLNEYAVNLNVSLPTPLEKSRQTEEVNGGLKISQVQQPETPKKSPKLNGSVAKQNNSNNSNNLSANEARRNDVYESQWSNETRPLQRPMSEKTKPVSRKNSKGLPSGRRYSGSYDLYRKERELYVDSRREERGRSSVKNRDYNNQQMYYANNAGYYDNELVYAQPVFTTGWGNGVDYSNIQQYSPPQHHYAVSYGSPEAQQPFVRGLPRQQSVPRSVSKLEHAPVSTRRLSERYHRRQRPSSHYEPYTDVYQKTTYF